MERQSDGPDAVQFAHHMAEALQIYEGGLDMELKIGARIMKLRRTKGMTQEQLAAALGVSAPAVSKWETDSSYPDITILCPLARALGADVDTLLAFEESLSEEQVKEYMNKILDIAVKQQDVPLAEKMLQDLLHQYPNSAVLKYYASISLTAMEMFSPVYAEKRKKEWEKQKKELLQEVRRSGDSVYWQQAVSLLATMALRDDDFELAEELLEEFPEQDKKGDMTFLWVLLYQKKGEIEKARQVTQKRLYTLVNQVISCLTILMGGELEPDTERALEIGKIYQKTEELFGVGNKMSEGVMMELYLRTGQTQKALDSLCRYVDILTGPVNMPKALLFSDALNTEAKEGTRAATREMRQLFLRELSKEEIAEQFGNREEYQAAMEKLRASI